jgi:hypothetical protein
MPVPAPAGGILFFARQATWMWRMQKLQEQISAKESIQRKGCPMPLISSVPRF